MTSAGGFEISPDNRYAYIVGNSTTAADGNLWVTDTSSLSLSALQTISHSSLGFTPVVNSNAVTLYAGGSSATLKKAVMAISPNGRFLVVAAADNTLHVFVISRGVPSDTTSALHALLGAANRSTAGNRAAGAVYGLLPATPVFKPVPITAPTSLALK